MATLFLLLGIAFGLSLIPPVFLLARAFRRFRGTRLIHCPNARRVAKIRLDAVHAAWSSVTEEAELRISSCSEWPARNDCAAKCLIRLEASPASETSLA